MSIGSIITFLFITPAFMGWLALEERKKYSEVCRDFYNSKKLYESEEAEKRNDIKLLQDEIESIQDQMMSKSK